jgi:glycosyltransferase involved in cell wall biosynthesis
MKILILTQYFPPETGAPQNRLFELSVRLQMKGADITVLTAMPNYPQMEIHAAYRGKKYCYETMSGLKVHRARIYVTKSRSILPRLLNYFSFVWTSWFAARKIKGDFDYIFCESPPLFLGITAWMLKRKKHAKLIFNVSDLWPESAERLGLVTNKLFLRLATKLEEFLYRHSELITGQTQGIVKNIQQRFPDKTLYWLPNGVDMELYKPEESTRSENWRNTNGFGADDFILLYAGIIGHSQGLEVVLKAADKLRDIKKIHFVILGSGPEKEMLIKLSESLRLTNVFFADAVGKGGMPAIIASCNAALIPLKKLDLFKGAIPSKIFENLAMKKPILLGVEGEAKELFIDEGKAGLAFIPEDADDLARKVCELESDRESLQRMGENGYDFVKRRFTRDLIASEFWSFLQKQTSGIRGAK